MTRIKETTYGVKEIANLFPSLMKIKQKSLREKVAAVWNESDHHRLRREKAGPSPNFERSSSRLLAATST